MGKRRRNSPSPSRHDHAESIEPQTGLRHGPHEHEERYGCRRKVVGGRQREGGLDEDAGLQAPARKIGPGGAVGPDVFQCDGLGAEHRRHRRWLPDTILP